MLYGRQLLGLPVYDEQGRLYATVKEYHADTEGILRYLLINLQGMLGRELLLPADRIQSLSLGGVVLRKGGKLPKARRSDHDAGIIGSSVYDANSHLLGQISDILLEGDRIAAVELSRGLYDDLLVGRSRLQYSALIPNDEGYKMP